MTTLDMALNGTSAEGIISYIFIGLAVGGCFGIPAQLDNLAYNLAGVCKLLEQIMLASLRVL